MDLRTSWAITREHLEKARSLLPASPLRADQAESIEAYQEFMDHNELELAMEQLEGIGEVNPCPRAFWEALRRAAENMGLANRAAYYEAKLTSVE